MAQLQIENKLSKKDKNTPREGFIFEIRMGQRFLKSFEFESVVRSITLSMSDDKIDSLKIAFNNTHDFLLDDNLFETGRVIELWMGYETFGLKYMGYFIVMTPTFDISSDATVIVEAYAKGILLTQEEKRFSYHNTTDSKIAYDIAIKYKLEPDIQNTNESYKVIIQGNKTDYEFLKDRASGNGFLFYIENNNLHFHKKKTIALDFSLHYGRAYGKIRDAYITVMGMGKNAIFPISDIDPATGKIINANTQFEIDNQTDKIIGVNDVNSYSFQKIRYLVGKGHNRNLKELSKISASATSASRYSVQLNCSVIGIELLKPARIINISGLMRFSGLYYIKQCKHIWNPELGYITKLVAYRTFIEPFALESVSKSLGFGERRNRNNALQSIVQVK